MKREQLNYYLQKVPINELSELCREIEEEATVELIQQPTSQTLLLPVHDPISQKDFISGELLVTSMIVLVNETQGWAMVMDSNPEVATSVAILDGAFAAGIQKEEIIALANRGREIYDIENTEMNQKIENTKVTFDLL